MTLIISKTEKKSFQGNLVTNSKLSFKGSQNEYALQIFAVPPSSWYPWVHGCREGPIEAKSRGPEHNHQVLKELYNKKLSKVA